jgi:hypothetical protein
MMNVGAQADEGVDRDADQEIDEGAPVGFRCDVLERGGQVGHEREKVNQVAEKDGGKIFAPPAGSRPEELPRHRHRDRLREGQIQYSSAGAWCKSAGQLVIECGAWGGM